MIVVDASAIVEILLRTPAVTGIDAALLGSASPLYAPRLVDIEVASAFRRLVAHGDIEPERGRRMLEVLLDMPIRPAHVTRKRAFLLK